MLHYHESGSGPAVLFVHGYPLNQTIWESQKSLADAFRVILPDLPGFGKSPASVETIDGYADTIKDLLDTLNIDRASIFGHSMGGYVLLSLADRYPERLDAMGLICSQAGGDPTEVREARLRTAENVEKQGTSAVADTMAEKLTAPSGAHLKETLRSIMRSASVAGVTSALRAMAARSDRFHVFSKLTVPVLVLSGAEDILIPEDKARLMADRLKLGKWIRLENCGHMPMMEQSERFNQEIRTFLTLVS